MPHVRIVHRTTYRYANPVRFTTHRVMLRPRDSHDLRLLGTGLATTPGATAMRWAHDVFGNSVCYLDWEGIESDGLEIVSTLDLDHFPAGAEAPQEALEPGAETYPFSYSPEEIPDLSRLIERHHPDPGHAVDAWVRRFVQGNDGPVHTMDLLVAITQAIKADFAYEARDAEGTNAPAETLATGRGACRDLALLMMEAVRSLGFAARFVSGYLYDDAAEPTVGGGATHAWCAVYLPGAGWVEFDPTNGLLAGRNLIRVCTARTPEQAVPVAGSFIGGETDFTGLDVDVSATVGPPEPDGQAGSSSSESPTEISPPSTTSA